MGGVVIGLSTNPAASNELRSDGSGNAIVTLPTATTQAGFAAMCAESDAGVVLGVRRLLKYELSESRRLRVGLDTPLFFLSFDGTNIPVSHVFVNSATSTFAQGSGSLSLNANSQTNLGCYALMRSNRTFSFNGGYATLLSQWVKETNENATGAISEWGLGYVATTAAPTDGIFWRRGSDGALKAVASYGGVETIVAISTSNVPTLAGTGSFVATHRNKYVIQATNDLALFWINGVLVANLSLPVSQANSTASNSAPAFARVYTSANASAGRKLDICQMSVEQADMNINKSWPSIMSGLGSASYQTQPNIGVATTQTTNWVNNTAPASASLSNTSAGYANIDGQWQMAASAVNETDWIVFGYLNPAGSNIITGKNLNITGIRIGETVVLGVSVVTTTVLQWGIAVGSSAISLATADASGTPSTTSPKRIPIGLQSIAAAAAIGTIANAISVGFNTPKVVPPGSYFHVILKQVAGAATPSLVFRGLVMVEGYFD